MGQSPTWGRPGCALASLGQSLVRVKIEGPAPPKGRNIVSRKCNLGGSTWAPITFLFVDQSSASFFAQRERGCSWSSTFPIFARSIRSGDIRDQNRKLFEIAPNFALPNFRRRAFPQNYAHLNTPASRHVAWKKFCDVTPTSRKVIGAHTLNFKPNLTC